MTSMVHGVLIDFRGSPYRLVFAPLVGWRFQYRIGIYWVDSALNITAKGDMQ